jgi:CHAD domain-containing protein/transposase
MMRAGFVCRIRQVNDRQLLTLKSTTPADGSLHRRQELEAEITGDQPPAWPDSEAKKAALDIIGETPLQTLFTIHQTRRKYHVFRQEQPVIELSLDEVAFNNPTEVDYCGLEAELIADGVETDLNEFVDRLQATWLLQPDSLSKFERGLANLDQASQKTGARNLSDEEKARLSQLAGDDNKNLSRRAMIILMSEAGCSPANIAGELELSVRTVQRWQGEFAKKRLAIFPEEALQPATLRSAVKSPAQVQTKPKAKPTQSKSRVKMVVKYRPRKKIGLKPTDTMAEAGRKVLGFHFAQMLKHESGARLGEDIEALHDMRVATRRMRAALRVFGSAFAKKKHKRLKEGLQATGRALGPVRDLDVLLDKLKHYQQELPEQDRPGLNALVDAWDSQRQAARTRMLAYLDSQEYLRFKQYLLKFVETKGFGARPQPQGQPTAQQLQYIVPRLIYSRYEEVGAYEPLLKNASLETLHQLRLTFKAFRYTLEFFQELLGKEGRAVIGELKAMQDHLGALNDAQVTSQLLHDFQVEWDKQQAELPLAERQSPAQVMGYLNSTIEERHRLLVSFPQAWANFNRPAFRRQLARAVGKL